MLKPAGWVVIGLLCLGGCQSYTSPKTEPKTAKKQVMAAPAPPATTVVPLLRPDSPVAHMLRERGLWRPAKQS